MKRFGEYVQEGIVKKRGCDKRRAAALRQRSEERLAFVASLLGNKPTFALENLYEAILEVLEAKLVAAGYKTYSHEAIVAFMLDLGFTLTETTIVDNLRKQRHGIKYYGDDATEDEAEAALAIAKKIIKKLA